MKMERDVGAFGEILCSESIQSNIHFAIYFFPSLLVDDFILPPSIIEDEISV
jgi:hypothetical protein